MRNVQVGRDTRSSLVTKAAAEIEKRLLARRHGGFGIDLDNAREDPTKADLVLALAVERLTKKYGEQLVVCRYRERINVAWRGDMYATVSQENRDKLTAVGFFGGAELTVDEIRSGIDPQDIGHPDDPAVQRRIQAARRHRVATWTAGGWHGSSDWKDAGGDPASVERLREQMRAMVKDGKVNLGGVEVTWAEPKAIITTGTP